MLIARCLLFYVADLKAVFLKYCRYGKGTGATQTEVYMIVTFGMNCIFDWFLRTSARVFLTFVQLDGKRFNKFCKENKLLHRKKFNGNACDLLFTSIKPKGAKVIDFSTFKDRGLPAIAQKLGITLDEVLSRVGGPQSSGTKAQYNKFHDDKSTWGAGVAAHGGPSTNDQKITLSNLADRSEADIRGSKKSKSNTGVDVAASHAFIYGTGPEPDSNPYGGKPLPRGFFGF